MKPGRKRSIRNVKWAFFVPKKVHFPLVLKEFPVSGIRPFSIEAAAVGIMMGWHK